ncbi:carbohydrate ABC transporter permease [Pseudochelatococcus sp. B33]
MTLAKVAIRTGRGLVLALIVFWSLSPIYFIVSSSFKVSRDIFSVRPSIFFFQPTIENYYRVVDRWPQFFAALWNSFLVTVSATLLVVISCGLAGYVYSRYRSRLLTMSAFGMIFIRMFPPIVISLPLFPWVNSIGLNDTLIILILLYASFWVSIGSWIMKAFFDQIPKEIDEAALMDGAPLFSILTRILLPLAAPGMVACAVFIVVFSWNEFLFAYVFASTNARTAPMSLSEMMDASQGIDWGVLFAAATIQLIPVIALVVVAQKYLIAGLTVGSVKG